MRGPSSPRFRTESIAIRRAFDPLRLDRTRGAYALSLEALRVLARLLRRWERRPPAPTELRGAFRAVASALEDAQPGMGPFLRWARDWRRLARSNRPATLLAEAHRWLRRERAELVRELPAVVRTFRGRFPHGVGTVGTLSRSQTVLRALSSLPADRRPHQVLVLESRPGGEGRWFARDLRGAGIPAHVLRDRRASMVATEAELVLIGADAVFRDGSVVHKVGTRTLAKAARVAGTPVVVLAGRSKWTDRPPPRRALPKLFDRTPSRYLSEIWTDRGTVPGRGAPLGRWTSRTHPGERPHRDGEARPSRRAR